MLLTNTNINTLPFYASINEQWHKRRYANYHAIYQNVYSLPTFQLIFSGTAATYKVELFDEFDVFVKQYNNASIGLAVKVYSGYKVLYCTGKELIDSEIAGKKFYLKVSGVGTNEAYYSDLFEFSIYTHEMLTIEYWNMSDVQFGDYMIFSGTSTKKLPFRAYLPTEIGKPKYTFENYISQREMYKFPMKMISNKEYTFPLVINEPQMDALRFAAISDKIAISQNGKIYKVLWIEFSEIEWRENGIGVCDATFTVDSVINVFSQARPTRGDFNDDFNDDFLI